MSDKSREEDLKELFRLRHYAKSRTARIAIEKSIWQIQHEDNLVKSMRESLIKATRNSDHRKIKEIHDYIASHPKYRAAE